MTPAWCVWSCHRLNGLIWWGTKWRKRTRCLSMRVGNLFGNTIFRGIDTHPILSATLPFISESHAWSIQHETFITITPASDESSGIIIICGCNVFILCDVCPSQSLGNVQMCIPWLMSLRTINLLIFEQSTYAYLVTCRNVMACSYGQSSYVHHYHCIVLYNA